MRTNSLLGAAVLTICAGAANAQLVLNGSFENVGNAVIPQDAGGGVSVWFYTAGSNQLPDWAVLGSGGQQVHNTSSASGGSMASDLDKWIDLTGITGYDGGVSTTFATLTGASYLLSFDLGALRASTFGNVTAEVKISNGISSIFIQTTSIVPGSWQEAGIDWKTFTMPFVANSSSTTISFFGRANGVNSNSNGIALDNVSVVPEPEGYGLALAGMGIVAFSLHRRRRLSA